MTAGSLLGSVQTQQEQRLGVGGAYLQDDEELIPRLALHHDFLSVFKLHRLQGVSDGQTLPLLQGLCSRG